MLLILGMAISLWGCPLPCEYDDEPERLAPERTCSEHVETAIGTFQEARWHLFEFFAKRPFGQKNRGKVVEVEGRRVDVLFRGERQSLLWPNALPFAIEPGEMVFAESDESSTTLSFAKGKLALHAGRDFARPRSMTFATNDVRWEEGCNSWYGRTLDLVVGEARIPPGESAEVQGWTVRNLGATLEEGETHCNFVTEGIYQGAWIAESTEPFERCFGREPPDRACSEAIVAANASGERHDFGIARLSPGAHRVLAVEANGLLLVRQDEPEGSSLHIRWPGQLPVAAEEGESVEVEFRDGWHLLTLPRGQLAIASVRDFSFEPPAFAPDGSFGILPMEGCNLDGSFAAMGLRLEAAEGEKVLYPGDEARIGAWTFRVLYAKERGPIECHSPEGIIVGEGLGEGALIAYRSLDTIDE